MVDESLDQENEIVVQLCNEAINFIWIVSIFEIVEADACHDAYQFQ